MIPISRKFYAVAAVFALVLAAAPVYRAQDDPLTRSRELYQEAISAYNQHDYGAYLRTVREIDALRPNHPRAVYMLAGAYALNGDEAKALAALNRLAGMGLVAEPEEDDDFASIRDSDAFAAVLGRFAANARPVGRSERAFTVPGQGDFIPEGVAYDPVSGNYYVGSVYKRAIVEVRPEEARSFGAWERGDGLWSVFALRVDPVRRVLWACSSAIEQTRWVNEDEIGYAGVFEYDLTSRLLVKRFVLSNARAKHLLGDMALSRAGEVYVTDSAEGSIYRVGGAGGVFERWLESERFSSPQGIAFTDDERHLFVADYSYGVFRIDTRNRELRLLPTPHDLTALGIDGLAYYKNSLIAIQNGVRPHRVVRLALSGNDDRIVDWEVLEANHPDFDEPTLGVVVPGPRRNTASFCYVANSHWGAFDRNGKLREDADLSPPVILKLDLD
jgi:DNA-binding beta-propeller fold protein YncE